MLSLSLSLSGYPINVPFNRKFNPLKLFTANEPGVWYDPSDMSTLFQDSAGTTPVTAVEQPVGLMLDKSGRNNHAFQATSTNRPVLSARCNLLRNTATLATQTVATAATTQTLRFEGAGTITLSGTATGTFSAGTHSVTTTAGNLTLTVSGTVTNADLRAANDGAGLPAYQRVGNVGVTPADYDTAGFPPYLRFDGIDDSLATNNIDFTSTDKMTVFAGVRKLSDAARGILVEFTQTTVGSASFGIEAPGVVAGPIYRWIAGGTIRLFSAITSGYPAPTSNVIVGFADISGQTIGMRINSTSVFEQTASMGTGNFANNQLFIGSRASTTLPFNGRLYQLIVRGAQTPAEQITAAEAFVNNKTKAY
jgi:hypothetical protein